MSWKGPLGEKGEESIMITEAEKVMLEELYKMAHMIEHYDMFIDRSEKDPTKYAVWIGYFVGREYKVYGAKIKEDK